MSCLRSAARLPADQLSHHLDSTVAGLDPHHVVPPVRRQVGVLSAIETVIEKLAHLLLLPDSSPSASDSGPQECYAQSILHVIIGVSRQCSSLLELRTGLTHSAVNALKLHLRPAGLARLTQVSPAHRSPAAVLLGSFFVLMARVLEFALLFVLVPFFSIRLQCA